MTKAERKLYLEYCREVGDYEQLDYEMHLALEKDAGDRFRKKLEAYRCLPWWMKLFTESPSLYLPVLYVPRYPKPTLEDFYRKRAEMEANAEA